MPKVTPLTPVPIGALSRQVVDHKRARELTEAIHRYLVGDWEHLIYGLDGMVKWSEELTERLQAVKTAVSSDAEVV